MYNKQSRLDIYVTNSRKLSSMRCVEPAIPPTRLQTESRIMLKLLWHAIYVEGERKHAERVETRNHVHRDRKSKQNQRQSAPIEPAPKRNIYNVHTFAAFIDVIGYGQLFDALTRALLWIADGARESAFLRTVAFIAKLLDASISKVCAQMDASDRRDKKKQQTNAN